MNRNVQLRAGRPLASKTGLKPGKPLGRTAGIRPVSDKRRAENRQRRAMVAAKWPERPACEWPGCSRLADDVHEKLTRARGGSITDPDNVAALCRGHHDYVTFTPESKLKKAYELGLLRHSWDGAR